MQREKIDNTGIRSQLSELTVLIPKTIPLALHQLAPGLGGRPALGLALGIHLLLLGSQGCHSHNGTAESKAPLNPLDALPALPRIQGVRTPKHLETRNFQRLKTFTNEICNEFRNEHSLKNSEKASAFSFNCYQSPTSTVKLLQTQSSFTQNLKASHVGQGKHHEFDRHGSSK